MPPPTLRDVRAFLRDPLLPQRVLFGVGMALEFATDVLARLSAQDRRLSALEARLDRLDPPRDGDADA